MYEHNAVGYWSGLTLCLTKVRSSRARCPATALIKAYTCSCKHENIRKSMEFLMFWKYFWSLTVLLLQLLL